MGAGPWLGVCSGAARQSPRPVTGGPAFSAFKAKPAWGLRSYLGSPFEGQTSATIGPVPSLPTPGAYSSLGRLVWITTISTVLPVMTDPSDATVLATMVAMYARTVAGAFPLFPASLVPGMPHVGGKLAGVSMKP